METLIYPEPSFTRKKSDSYVMELQNRYFNINEEVHVVMSILSKSFTYEEATKKYMLSTGENYTTEEFQGYAEEILKKFKLNEETKSFLLVEKIILPEKQTSILAKGFMFLFKPVLFWFSFASLTLFSLFALFVIPDHNHTGNSFEVPLLFFALIYIITLVFHELGHIAAAREFTGKNGGIGIGIYLIYPILFSDISSIWTATKQQKVITNLAGVYMQLGCAALLYVLGSFTDYHFFTDFSKAIMWICFIQILPFLRSDGYWLLSDLTNTPNLQEKSNEKFNQLFLQPNIFFKNISSSSIFLFAYGLLNTALIVLFAFYQLKNNRELLIGFPSYLVETLQLLISGKWEEIKFNSNHMQVVLFYYLAIIYIQKLYKMVLKFFKK